LTDLASRRRFFAEEIEAVANLKTASLVEALATIPREQFLPRGPWLVQGDISGPRQTPDADPSRVYHNYSIAIDPARQLFNGAPGLIAGTLDVLRLKPGDRVLHVGAGLGYYSALIGHIVRAAGQVLAIEVDEQLADAAGSNLAAMPWVEVRAGNATAPLERQFDAILVSAGTTHPQDAWLEALAPGGRLILPLTAGLAAMGPIGKGVLTQITNRGDGSAQASLDARVLTFIAIYSGIGLRDEHLNEALGKALMRVPFPPLRRLRRDPHEPTDGCWLHGDRFCFSMA
jgi:protein-L-isoaspartate(D-aspartate) O-methyltransferase